MCVCTVRFGAVRCGRVLLVCPIAGGVQGSTLRARTPNDVITTGAMTALTTYTECMCTCVCKSVRTASMPMRICAFYCWPCAMASKHSVHRRTSLHHARALCAVCVCVDCINAPYIISNVRLCCVYLRSVRAVCLCAPQINPSSDQKLFISIMDMILEINNSL